MKRKDFLSKGIVALGGVVALSGMPAARSRTNQDANPSSDDCEVSPRETKGPFPNKTPSASDLWDSGIAKVKHEIEINKTNIDD